MSSSQPSERASSVNSSSGGAEGHIKALGLTELYTSKTPEADIVFVHGSGGSPRKTWVYKGNLRRDPADKADVRSIVDRLMSKVKRGTREPVFWPADILPQDHHDVRIMTYGYQSNRRKFLSRTKNKLTITQHGNQFLESIARARHNARGRPIIFVAHDRGGLIVKQAIVEAKKQKKERLPELHDIYESFQGVVFLGTPHRCPEDSIRPLTSTTKSPDVDLKAKVSSVPKIDHSTKQSTFGELYNEFCDIIIEEEVIRVSNFEEAKKKARILATRKKVLSDYFSTFGVRDWERTDVINADRTNMCRYPNREDDGYDKVRNAIGFHLAVKRSKAKEGVCRERSSVGPSNVENTANWRESDASTVIFDCNGLSHDTKEKIVQWVHRFAPTKSQMALRNAFLRKLEYGTGTWFLGLEELDRWLNAPLRNLNSRVNRLLWFTGEPGIGKTILSCVLIEHLEQVSTASTFGFAWFLCNAGEQQTGTSLSLSITRKLLQQLLKQDANLPASMFRIYKKYEKHDSEEPELLEEECLELLKSVVAKISRVYIVVDGLDELNHDSRAYAIKTIEALLSSGAYCMITSRAGQPDLEQSFSKRATRLNIGASEPDIWTYLENHISEPCPLASVISANGQGLREEVIAAISRNSDGMMLLAQQNLKELSDENTLEGLETAIANLSNSVEDLYRDTWDRIKRNNSQKVFERVQQVLMWVVFAPQPLTVPELRHALAIRDESDEFNPKALWVTPLDEFSLGLIVIDENQTIRLCHKSAYAYFKTNLDKFSPNANETLAKTCLRYLLLNSLSPGQNPTIEDIARQAEMYPFLRYSFENWHVHARLQMTSDVQELAMRFLQDSAKVTTSYRLYRYMYYGEDTSKSEFTGTELIASLDLGESFMPLQDAEFDLRSSTCEGDTSIQSAVEVDQQEKLEEIRDGNGDVEKDEVEEGRKEEEEVELEEEGQAREGGILEADDVEEDTKQSTLSSQGPEADSDTLEDDSASLSQEVEERMEEDKGSEEAGAEVEKNKGQVEELGEERETLDDADIESELTGTDTGEATMPTELDSPTPQTGYVDIQKVIRNFLVDEGRISTSENHRSGTRTPVPDSSPEETLPQELPEDQSILEESNADSPENRPVTPLPQIIKSGLDEAPQTPSPSQESTQALQSSNSPARVSLLGEHRLSSPHMGAASPTFKLPSIFSGRQYGSPSASLKERVGARPLYLTPMGERESLIMKQYSSNSLPARKQRETKTRSTSDIYDFNGVLTLPKRNMYLYPTARDKFESKESG